MVVQEQMVLFTGSFSGRKISEIRLLIAYALAITYPWRSAEHHMALMIAQTPLSRFSSSKQQIKTHLSLHIFHFISAIRWYQKIFFSQDEHWICVAIRMDLNLLAVITLSFTLFPVRSVFLHNSDVGHIYLFLVSCLTYFLLPVRGCYWYYLILPT